MINEELVTTVVRFSRFAVSLHEYLNGPVPPVTIAAAARMTPLGKMVAGRANADT